MKPAAGRKVLWVVCALTVGIFVIYGAYALTPLQIACDETDCTMSRGDLRLIADYIKFLEARVGRECI